MQDIQELLASDLDQELISAIRDEFIGEYTHAYWDRSAPPGGFIPKGNDAWKRIELERLRVGRRALGNDALLKACRHAKVPAELRTLPCNGQVYAVARINRILLIQEPLLYVGARPSTADYKRQLASSAFAVRQLEFDFGDGFRSRIDPRNTVLATLLHGWDGSSFSQAGTALNSLSLNVADEAYNSWLRCGNVLTADIAERLGWLAATTYEEYQRDLVSVHWKDSKETQK